MFAPFAIEAARSKGDVVSTSRSGGDVRCDLTDLNQVASLMEEVQPDCVIHCAAMADVDACERDPAAATLANEQATANIVRCVEDGTRIVYLSTDQVYPDTQGPHMEGTEAPVNVYGRSKLAGEKFVEGWEAGLVARTSFFGRSMTPGRRSLSDFMLNELGAGNPVRLFTDILFSPLHAQTLAAMLTEMIGLGLSGVFNIASRSGMSKADFGLEIARNEGLQTQTAKLSASAAIPGRAHRISDLRLDPGKLERSLGRPMPELSDEIAKL